MKQAAILVAARLAAGFVVPKVAIDQVALSINEPIHNVPTWWDTDAHEGSVRTLEESFERALEEAELAVARMLDGDDHDDESNDDDGDHHGGHGHHGDPTKTIYELIKESKYTTHFAALVDEHDDIKELLASTKTNRTLFVPTDRAFERIPKDHKKPPAEFIRAALAYAIVPGRYPSRRLYFSHTLPTELALDDLGGHAQRLRVSSSLVFGTHINFFGKVVARDIAAKNGVIHAVDALLPPPPRTGKIIQLLPDAFSTFSLALVTTGLGQELEELVWTGGTAFVPTNRAFARLGPRANAFLFSDHGRKYLKALLQYTVVANETLYSDAFYKGKVGDDENDKSGGGRDYWHVDLPSLLHDEPISVDVKRWRGLVSIVANGYTRVAVQDVIGEDGVLQVINSVLIPPRRHGRGVVEVEDEDREWSVEELVERLDPYLSEPAKQEPMGDL